MKKKAGRHSLCPKWFCKSSILITDSFTLNDLNQCHPKYSKIQGNAHIFDIPHIHFKLFIPAYGIAAINLFLAGDTGAFFAFLPSKPTVFGAQNEPIDGKLPLIFSLNVG